MQAKAYKDGAISSVVAGGTFFLHPDGQPQDLPIISLTTQENHLFDYEDGLFTPGIDFDQWREQNLTANWFSGPWSDRPFNSNRTGRESEYPIRFEFFEPDNALPVVNQLAGFRIHGQSSRTFPLKSLRLYARDEYDSNGDFKHNFFEESVFAAIDSDNDKYRNFVIRSHTFADWVVSDAMNAVNYGSWRLRPALQYINGEFWGITSIRDRFDEHHFSNHFGVDRDNTIVIDYGSLRAGNPEDINLWESFQDFLTDADLASNEDYDQLSEMLCIQSYIDAIIVNYYFANNQLETGAWRTRKPGQGTYNDGKWRIYTKDFDNTFGSEDLLANISPDGVLMKLFGNERFKRAFVNRFADLINTTFHPTNINNIVSHRSAMLQEHLNDHNHRWSSPYVTNERIQHCLNFGATQPNRQRGFITQKFSLPGTAEVTLGVGSGEGSIRINTVDIVPETPGVTETPYPWSGVYFQGVPITIRAIPNPGYQFVEWVELPGEQSAEVEVNLIGDATFTALFEEIPPAAVPTLIHCWNFEALNFAVPSQTTGGASLTAQLGSGAEWLRNSTAKGFTTSHLRVNSPQTSTLTFNLPSSGFEELVFEFETRRSGQGAGVETLSYTINGSDWTELESYVVANEAPQSKSFNFAGIPGVADNPVFAVRITFSQGDGGLEGNNRFDNVTLRGFALPGVNLPPVVVQEIGRREIAAGLAPLMIDLSEVFADPDPLDVLIYTCEITSPSLTTVTVTGDILEVSGLAAGNALVTVTASDGTHTPVVTSFALLCYPTPRSIATGDYVFTSWLADEPAGNFPPHMVFLQGEGNDDTDLATQLTRAYEIPPTDAAEEVDASFPYAASSRTRINGLGQGGIGLINTGRGRDLGGTLLALDTRGVSEANVTWVNGTVLPNTRVYAIRLQARTSLEDDFTDVIVSGQPVEYLRNESTGHRQIFGPIALPSPLLEQENLQLLWRYYHVSGESGARALLSLDDIVVTSSSVPRSYAAWRISEYPNLDERDNEEISGSAAISSNWSNILRYALGAGRNEKLTPFLPTLEKANNTFLFSFPYDGIKNDLVYRVHRSNDLSNWNEVLFDSSLNDPTDFTNMQRLEFLHPIGQQHFYRLEVELTP